MHTNYSNPPVPRTHRNDQEAEERSARNESPRLLLIDRPISGVTRVQLNRPEARNALSTPLRQALSSAFVELSDDDETRCIVITGGDQWFAAGADLKEIASLKPSDVRALRVLKHWRNIAECPKPIIAAVAGPALGGGCELALQADVILAARDAHFGLPEVKVGVMPGGGGTQRLVRAIGRYRAMKLMLTGEPVTADEAWRLGFVTEVIEKERLMERALELASIIASRPAVSLQMIKEVVLAGGDAALSTGLMLERRSFELLFDTHDQKEGMQAFIERRRPEFSGD